jgi:ribosomal protein S18 acetylase RimI-like enzyme
MKATVSLFHPASGSFGWLLRPARLTDAAPLALFAAEQFTHTYGGAMMQGKDQQESIHAHLQASFGVPQQTQEIGNGEYRTLLAWRRPTDTSSSSDISNQRSSHAAEDEEGSLEAYCQVRRSSLPPDCVRQALVSSSLLPRTEQQKGIPIELLRFYVAPAAQGQGLAQELMQEAQDAADDLATVSSSLPLDSFDFAALWLSVWEENPRALAFYRKAGFSEVGQADFWVGSDRQRDRILLRLPV